MKRFKIAFAAHTAADEGYLLWTAAKIIHELQAMGTACHLTAVEPPWQLAMEGTGADLRYIETQVCDMLDGRRGRLVIEEAT